jgi:hypothetical protein
MPILPAHLKDQEYDNILSAQGYCTPLDADVDENEVMVE